MSLAHRPTRWDGWLGVALFALGGLLGGILGAILVGTLVPGGSSFLVDSTPLASILLIGAVTGGVVGGWFVATLLLSRSPGRVHCPRCGTPNPRDVPCRACGF